MATPNTLSHPPLPISLNIHIAFLQNAIIALLTEQAELCDKIERLRGLVEEVRWEMRHSVTVLGAQMECSSCLNRQFEAAEGFVGSRDVEEGAEKENSWSEGEIVKGEFDGR